MCIIAAHPINSNGCCVLGMLQTLSFCVHSLLASRLGCTKLCMLLFAGSKSMHHVMRTLLANLYWLFQDRFGGVAHLFDVRCICWAANAIWQCLICMSSVCLAHTFWASIADAQRYLLCLPICNSVMWHIDPKQKELKPLSYAVALSAYAIKALCHLLYKDMWGHMGLCCGSLEIICKSSYLTFQNPQTSCQTYEEFRARGPVQDAVVAATERNGLFGAAGTVVKCSGFDQLQ